MGQALDAVFTQQSNLLFENLENAGALRCEYRFPACCGCDISTQGSRLQVNKLNLLHWRMDGHPNFAELSK